MGEPKSLGNALVGTELGKLQLNLADSNLESQSDSNSDSISDIGSRILQTKMILDYYTTASYIQLSIFGGCILHPPRSSIDKG